MRRVAVVTVSDRAFTGDYEDRSGPVVVQMVRQRLGWEVVETSVVPDDRARISAELIRLADDAGWTS